MEWVSIISLAIPLVSSLVKLVEETITESKSGAVKKQTVTDMINVVSTGMSNISTGGQKDTWTAIAKLAPILIDPVVEIMNNMSNMFGGKDIISGATPEDSFKLASSHEGDR